MYRAIIFDFYSVWGPDNLSAYAQQLTNLDQDSGASFQKQLNLYYADMCELKELVDSLDFKFRSLGQPVDTTPLLITESAISPQAIQFIQYLHGHFLKVGLLANLGKQERAILQDLQQKLDLFDAIATIDTPDETLLSPPVFARALKQLGEPPESCLAVSGHEPYLQFAETLGMGVMPFEGFPKLIQELNAIIQPSA